MSKKIVASHEMAYETNGYRRRTFYQMDVGPDPITAIRVSHGALPWGVTLNMVVRLLEVGKDDANYAEFELQSEGRFNSELGVWEADLELGWSVGEWQWLYVAVQPVIDERVRDGFDGGDMPQVHIDLVSGGVEPPNWISHSDRYLLSSGELFGYGRPLGVFSSVEAATEYAENLRGAKLYPGSINGEPKDEGVVHLFDYEKEAHTRFVGWRMPVFVVRSIPEYHEARPDLVFNNAVVRSYIRDKYEG